MRPFFSFAAMVTVLVCASTAMTAGSTAGASVDQPSKDWKQYRHDAAHTGFNQAEDLIGASNVAGLSLRWSKGPGQSVPQVEHGHILSCAADTCFNRMLTNGALIWTYGQGTRTVSTTIGADSLFVMGSLHQVASLGLATGTPGIGFGVPGGFHTPATVDHARVYVTGPRGHLDAYDAATGALDWRSAKEFSLAGGYSSGVTAAGLDVYASSCGQLVALRARDGRFRWASQLPGATSNECGGLPSAAGSQVFVTTSQVGAYDAVTGATQWTATGDGGQLSDPAVAYGRVYVVSPAGGTVVAYDTATGLRVWTSPTSGTSAPSVANGVVYVSGAAGLQAYDAASGALLTTLAGQFSGEPVISEGSLITQCTTAGGNAVCVYQP
jgi:outer membrane protein assembly factor BamB